MVVLEQLREQTLQKLGRHYAAGDLRLGTLEHRLEETLAAEFAEDMAGVTWDLPALDRSVWEKAKAHVSRPPTQEPARRIEFRAMPVPAIVLRGPRTWLIGRSRCCEVVLLDPAISRRHALVSFRGGQCSVRDLGSTNAVHVNGNPVDTAVLQPGDVLTIGGTVDAIVS
jgi:FHA domain/Domain of unknown function (DUF1707)